MTLKTGFAAALVLMIMGLGFVGELDAATPVKKVVKKSAATKGRSKSASKKTAKGNGKTGSAKSGAGKSSGRPMSRPVRKVSPDSKNSANQAAVPALPPVPTSAKAGTGTPTPTPSPAPQGTESAGLQSETEFMTEFPHLDKYRYREPSTNIRFGFGLAPVQIMKNKEGIGINILEIHWAWKRLDWNVFTASYGFTISGDPVSKVNAFVLRTSPKFKVNDMISFGPMAGYELISFPQVTARLYRDIWFTPIENFSAQGFIYGATLSETLTLSNRFALRLNQVAYRETYNVVSTHNGWKFAYTDDALNKDKSPISPGLVFMLEASFLY